MPPDDVGARRAHFRFARKALAADARSLLLPLARRSIDGRLNFSRRSRSGHETCELGRAAPDEVLEAGERPGARRSFGNSDLQPK